jgi:hypothetical protein
MVDDTYDGYLLLFGGEGLAGNLTDTWSFVNGAWSKLTPAASPPSQYSPLGVAFDAADNSVALLGSAPSPALTWTY